MKIEHSRTFSAGKIVAAKDILVPYDDRDEVTDGFIKNYHQKTPLKMGTSITIALCVLGKNESWTNVARELRKDQWFGASLVEWQFYIQDKSNIKFGTVVLPGVRYRDDDLREWVPAVHHRTRIFLKNATEVSMKLSSSLAVEKQRTVLIKKLASPKR
ncbi:MAG: hypothetical protein A2937_01235 [Candidatus Yonathbacteria bacterium RIFCSPLOWO2_01_FULL_47_33b]|uniref:Uncharacterized protein n=1 Tax=Candidatus Yonathbacteria bacterium RIFCSPLOWO2_01_FULL_47_33b TaxID=1802727 RepID=A0A1G2SH56_9BACT|nr:MAG: hypothetical protein A2937_01235 [Candidatus Yonathbacteria bacterium RIFCSPLOWO2_01_FULL_47_33b]